MAASAKPRAGIQSVEIAARILSALTTAGKPLQLKDLAKLSQMHPGKVHRYLVSLTRSELVAQDPLSAQYRIGPMAIAMGLAGIRNIEVVRTASTLLPALRDETDETVVLSLWSPAGPVVFDLEESSRPVYMNIRVGSILPLDRTATGRVFAAFLPNETTDQLLSAVRRPRIGKAARLRERFDSADLVAEVRRVGLASVSGDLVPGVNALAVPVFDHKGRIAAVIGILGRSEELDISVDGSAARALKATAMRVSGRLGFNADAAAADLPNQAPARRRKVSQA